MKLNHARIRENGKKRCLFDKVNETDNNYIWQWKHYTLEEYVSALGKAGFVIDSIIEPQPIPETKKLNPELYKNAIIRPVFLIIKAIKRLNVKS